MSIKATLKARKRKRRILWTSVLVLVIAVIVVAYLIAASFANPYSNYIGQPVSPSILQQITGVRDSTLSAVGSPSGVTPPAAISGSPLTLGGKPEILYVGGEFCPFCAIERWSMITALSRFGNFTGLEYMQSSSTDVNPNTPTFTFRNATFTGKYIAFVPVEQYGRGGQTDVRQALTAAQRNLISQYDTCKVTGQSGGIPFLDIANAYAVNCGSQFQLPSIAGANWTQVSSQLDTPSSNVAQLIDGAANTLITAICKVDGGQPGSVCTQSYATLALAYNTSASLSYSTQLAVASRAESRWTV